MSQPAKQINMESIFNPNTGEKQALFRIIKANDQGMRLARESGALDRELSIIGAVLAEPKLYYDLGKLSQYEFTDVNCAVLWFAIQELAREERPITDINAAQYAKDKANSDYTTMAQTASLALQRRAKPEAILDAQDKVIDLDIRIRMKAILDIVERDLNNAQMKPIDLLANSQYYIARLIENAGHSDASLSSLIDNLKLSEPDGSYLKTGWRKFDEWAGGLPIGKVTIWAGLSGEGKTTSMLDIVLYTLQNGGRVLIFISDTQGKAEIVTKLLAKLAGKEPRFLTPSDKTAHEDRMKEWDLIFKKPDKLTPQAVEFWSTHYNIQKPIDLIGIEGLYLMYDDAISASSPNWMHNEPCMRALIEFAENKPYPILISHQLKTDILERSTKVPQQGDLRGSDAVHQIGQSIYAIIKQDDDENIAHLYCMKHRTREINGDFIILSRNGKHGYDDPTDKDDIPF